jgi:phenylalanyl-tRNA synthetase alpha chain
MGDLLSQLHPLERKLLPFLEKYSSVEELIRASGMKDVEVMRAVQWLTNKKVLTLKEESKDVINLDKNGTLYLNKGLPERRFLAAISKETGIKEIEKKADLSKEEVNICLGILKRKAAITIRKGKDVFVALTDQGKALLTKETLEEKFLKKQFPRDPQTLLPEEQYAYQELSRRKAILRKEVHKRKTVHITELGKKLTAEAGKEGLSDTIGLLTPELLKNKAWKTKKMQSYDVSVRVPKIAMGKRHFESETISFVRRIFLDMGFEEMKGTYVQPAFWNFDALFVPQDHPAREMQDTFYLKEPKTCDLPKNYAQKVKRVHENGADTGSIGWQSVWSEERAKELLLRTHTTSISAHTLTHINPDQLPKKYFIVGKGFRNEALDWKHLFEFYFVEGIVVDPKATFAQLLWYLQEFYKKMGYEQVRFKPSYFPFTEPSVEVEVFNKEKNTWVELGGAGVFRPEVVKPLLGIDVPVLAWGLGLGRIMMPAFDLKDIRDINFTSFTKLKAMKKWNMLPKESENLRE